MHPFTASQSGRNWCVLLLRPCLPLSRMSSHNWIILLSLWGNPLATVFWVMADSEVHPLFWHAFVSHYPDDSENYHLQAIVQPEYFQPRYPKRLNFIFFSWCARPTATRERVRGHLLIQVQVFGNLEPMVTQIACQRNAQVSCCRVYAVNAISALDI